MEENKNEEVREETSEEVTKTEPERTGQTVEEKESGSEASEKAKQPGNADVADGEFPTEERQGMPEADGSGQNESDGSEDGQDEDGEPGDGQNEASDNDGEGDASSRGAEDDQDAEPQDNENTDNPGHGENIRRGLFGKKKKDKRDQQIEELTDRVQRQMAEFDNFRKRSEKEKSAMYEIGAKSVIEKILPTIDNFERGFAGLSEEQKEDPFVQGMEKVYRQMMTTLEGIGVTPIEAVGKPFDPNFHNAVMHVEDEGAEENVVVEEFQKGYLYRDAVVRHSMVKVAN